MATIDIDTTLHYERSGAGPAMLFVHGMCGDADVFADQARRFADRATCVRYDRRGHSRSGRGGTTISVARHADDAAALIEALDLAPCLIVGSSSGAVIALDVALRYGRLLRAAVLSEPPLFGLDPAAGQALIGELDISASDLSALVIPILVITGDTSHPALRSVAHRLAAALPDARLVELAGCGHVTYAEQPDAFAHAVAMFAAELERRT